jgi:Family of unknown function (DUF5763)
MAQCKATTSSGGRCKCRPHKDGLCFFHSDPRKAAEPGLFWLLMFRWARLVWLLLPRFWMAQFPWRSLYVLNLALAVALAIAAYPARRRTVWLGAAVAVWLVLGVVTLRTAPWLPGDIHELIAAAHSPGGYVGIAELIWTRMFSHTGYLA